jgi:hypothetical protein
MQSRNRESDSRRAVQLSDIPRVKPFFKDIHIDNDGRIWALLFMPSERRRQETSKRAGTQEPDWREPVAYDVFEQDGSYLGRVPVPDGTRLLAMQGGRIWGVVRNEDGVQFLRRFRLVWS